MKLSSNLTLLGLITGQKILPQKNDQKDPVAALKETESIRQSQMRIQIQHWEMGVAASDEISRRFLSLGLVFISSKFKKKMKLKFNQNWLKFNH